MITVKYLHEKNFANLNLKPSLISNFNDNQIKLIDFFKQDFFNQNDYYLKNSKNRKSKQKFSGKNKDIFNLGKLFYYFIKGEKLNFSFFEGKDKIVSQFRLLEFPFWADSILIDFVKLCIIDEPFTHADVNKLINHDFFCNEKQILSISPFEPFYHKKSETSSISISYF